MMPEQHSPGKVVIAGGTGFLGTNLAHYLATRGFEIVLISRNAPTTSGPWRHALWTGRSLDTWHEEIDQAQAIVNLAGRSVDCIKTLDNCDAILRSRVEATIVLGQAVRAVSEPPKAWVQMSTAHIYGDPAVAVCDEGSATGYGLAPFVGNAWEAAFADAVLPSMRQVVLRTSFVIGRNGGAIPRLAQLAKLGLGGKVGHGRQGISWLHQEDMNRLFYRSIVDESMQGMYVATAPHPVSNAEFMRVLRRAMRVPIGLPAPAWLARIGARFVMRTDPELALYGRYCVSQRLEKERFAFKYPLLEPALHEIFH